MATDGSGGFSPVSGLPGRQLARLARAKSSPWQQLSLLVRAHDLDRLVGGQSRVQELLDGPSLLLDEVCDQEAISRIGTVCLHHGDVDRTVSKCVSQLLQRLPVLDPHIVGKAFPNPFRQAKKTSHTDMFAGNNM